MLVPKIPRKLQLFHKFVQTLKFSNDQLCADKDADNDWDDGDVNRWGGRAQWAQWVCEEEIVRVFDTCDRPAQ